LIRPIGHNRLGVAVVLKVKGILVCAETLNLHLIGELAFRWVELPVADEGVVRGPQRSGRQASNEQQSNNTFEHCCSPLGSGKGVGRAGKAVGEGTKSGVVGTKHKVVGKKSDKSSPPPPDKD
jgi:hypothetical protein